VGVAVCPNWEIALPYFCCTVQAHLRVKKRLICFVVYGQNVNSGTVSMTDSVQFSEYIKNSGLITPIAFIGSYVQALPKKTLIESGEK
jgi:hypothetical protein